MQKGFGGKLLTLKGRLGEEEDHGGGSAKGCSERGHRLAFSHLHALKGPTRGEGGEAKLSPPDTQSEEWEPVSAVSTKLTGTHHPTAVESQMSFPKATSWQDYASHSLSSNTEYIKKFHFCC